MHKHEDLSYSHVRQLVGSHICNSSTLESKAGRTSRLVGCYSSSSIMERPCIKVIRYRVIESDTPYLPIIYTYAHTGVSRYFYIPYTYNFSSLFLTHPHTHSQFKFFQYKNLKYTDKVLIKSIMPTIQFFKCISF